MISKDFSQPQRQSVAGILITAIHLLRLAIKVIIFPLVLLFIKIKANVFYLLLIIAALFILSVIYAYFYFIKFTFYINASKQEFIVDKGVFNRTHLGIPLEKIQQVNIDQNLIQKIIGVYSVKIDTAGSESKEVSIGAIDEELAYSLKQQLLQHPVLHHENLSVQNENTSTSAFIKISPLTLLKTGLTSNYGQSLLLLCGFIYAIIHYIKEVLKAFDNDKGQIEHFMNSSLTLFSVSFLIPVVLLILLATNVTRTFIKYFDFEISRHIHSLLISSGLFAKKTTLITPNKVQITAYSQNYFQRKLKLFNLELKQAHGGHDQSEKEKQSANLVLPGCSPVEKDEIIKLILSQLPSNGSVYKPNFRFLNLPIFFKIIIPLAIYTIFYFNTDIVKPFVLAAILYALIGITMLYISYKNHRITVTDDFIIKQSGIWDITHEIITPHKIQTIAAFQYPWHKGLDIGHVNLHTAAGTIHFKFGNYTQIKKLVNWWLFQVESSNQSWM